MNLNDLNDLLHDIVCCRRICSWTVMNLLFCIKLVLLLPMMLVSDDIKRGRAIFKQAYFYVLPYSFRYTLMSHELPQTPVRKLCWELYSLSYSWQRISSIRQLRPYIGQLTRNFRMVLILFEIRHR